MEENVNFGLLPVKGHCRVELHDAETGELTDVREGDNFLSYGLLNTILKQIQKAVFVGLCPNAGLGLPEFARSDFTSCYFGAFRYLVLTDSTAAESPATESSVPGNVVGWCDLSQYAGTVALRGTLNYAETFANENGVKWVFDFGTDKANGTINSVCWSFELPEDEHYLGSDPRACMTNIQYLTTLSRFYDLPNGKISIGDGYFWGVSDHILYKIDPVTFEEVNSYPSVSDLYGSFIVHDGYLYYRASTYKVRKLNLSDMSYVDGPSSIYSGYNIYATDGTYVYLHYPSSSTRIYRVKMSDLANAGYVAGPSFKNLGIFFVAGLMYVETDTGIYEMDFASGVYTKITKANTGAPMFSDGTNIYTTYTEQYKSYSQSTISRTSSLNRLQLAAVPNSGTIGLKVYNLMARKLLDAPIVKTSAHVMKIIYEFTFS